MSDLTDVERTRTQYADESGLETRRSVWRPAADGRDLIELALAVVDGAAPATMLEIGCGPGVFAERVAAQQPNLTLTVSDTSERFVELARARGLDARLADAQDLPFGDASYDLVVAMSMLYHVPDLHRALAEVRRVLRPGGTFLAVTNGDAHVADLRAAAGLGPVVTHFSSENGEASLRQHFEYVTREDLSPRAVFADHAAAAAYLASFEEPDWDLPRFEGPREYAGRCTVFVAR